MEMINIVPTRVKRGRRRKRVEENHSVGEENEEDEKKWEPLPSVIIGTAGAMYRKQLE